MVGSFNGYSASKSKLYGKIVATVKKRKRFFRMRWMRWNVKAPSRASQRERIYKKHASPFKTDLNWFDSGFSRKKDRSFFETPIFFNWQNSFYLYFSMCFAEYAELWYNNLKINGKRSFCTRELAAADCGGSKHATGK